MYNWRKQLSIFIIDTSWEDFR